MDEPSPEQIARYRTMTPGERWDQARALYWMARRLRESRERMLHPDWTDDEIHEYVRKVFLRAGT